ncbi:MAG: permease-like cell division protein FtsX [Lysobacterales bacterium]
MNRKVSQKKSSSSLRAFFEHHLGSAGGSLGRLVKRPLGSVMTAAVLAVAMGLPAALYWLVDNLQSLGSAYPDAREISLFLPLAANEQQAQTLATELSEKPTVDGVRLLDPEQELARFTTRFSAADALAALEENPLPWVVVVSPATSVRAADDVAKLAKDLELMDGVETAQVDMKWLARLNALLALAGRGVLVLAGLLSLAALLIVGNTIGLELKTRREEIEITRLLGATDGFVRRPFLYLGLWYGLAGGLLAALVIFLGISLLAGPVAQFAQSYGSEQALIWPGPLFVAVLIGGGGLIGWLGAWLASSRQIAGLNPT